MERSSEHNQSRDRARQIAAHLADTGADDVVALDVSERSPMAYCFVIATATSEGRMRGLVRRAQEKLDELDLQPRGGGRRLEPSGWVLIDCGTIVIHLMLAELRAFYELERLWFDSPTIYPDTAPGGERGTPTDESGAGTTEVGP